VSPGAAALAAVRRIVDGAGEADEVLRAVCAALVEEGGCSWAGISLVERGELVLGPEHGVPRPELRVRAPVAFQGDRVAELAADGCADPALLEQVAPAIAPYCLVAWDTGGVPWDPSA
jgi:hypothetical protein